MNFTQAITSCFSQYADAKGRAGRSEYWYFVLFNLGLTAIVDLVDGRSDKLSDLVSLAILLPGITAGIRRMHDVGKSGWFFLVPFYNLYLAIQPSQAGANQWGTTRTV